MMKKRLKVRKTEETKLLVFHPVPHGQAASTLLPLPRGQYWLRQTGDNTQNKRLGPTSLEEQIDVGGFKFNDAPIRWELATVEPEVSTCLRLLRMFRLETRWWRKPMAWLRNPEREGQPIFGQCDVIIALYGKNFHVTIERYHTEIFGPHPCRLYYRSWQVPGQMAWIGICQIEAMWHSDERMLKALNHEIKNRRFWQSDATAETIILK